MKEEEEEEIEKGVAIYRDSDVLFCFRKHAGNLEAPLYAIRM